MKSPKEVEEDEYFKKMAELVVQMGIAVSADNMTKLRDIRLQMTSLRCKRADALMKGKGDRNG